MNDNDTHKELEVSSGTGGVVVPLVQPPVAEEDQAEESDGSYDGYNTLRAFEQWMHDSIIQLIMENQALHGEVIATRSQLTELRTYVQGLEERAAEMASPEKMQEAMQKMMGGMF